MKPKDLSDLLRLILVIMFKDGMPLPQGYSTWHKLFYVLGAGRRDWYPEIFASLRWDYDGPHPTCPELTNLLIAFKHQKMIVQLSPSFREVYNEERTNGWANDFRELLKEQVPTHELLRMTIRTYLEVFQHQEAIA